MPSPGKAPSNRPPPPDASLARRPPRSQGQRGRSKRRGGALPERQVVVCIRTISRELRHACGSRDIQIHRLKGKIYLSFHLRSTRTVRPQMCTALRRRWRTASGASSRSSAASLSTPSPPEKTDRRRRGSLQIYLIGFESEMRQARTDPRASSSGRAIRPCLHDGTSGVD